MTVFKIFLWKKFSFYLDKHAADFIFSQMERFWKKNSKYMSVPRKNENIDLAHLRSKPGNLLDLTSIVISIRLRCKSVVRRYFLRQKISPFVCRGFASGPRSSEK